MVTTDSMIEQILINLFLYLDFFQDNKYVYVLQLLFVCQTPIQWRLDIFAPKSIH